MGFDQTTNVILSDSTERVYSMEEGVEEVPLGLYIVRGDNIVSPPPSLPSNTDSVLPFLSPPLLSC